MKISIFGLGYVGAVSLACLARDGHEVTGVDIDQAKLDLIREGKSPIIEEGIQELMKEVADSQRVHVTTDCAEAVNNSEISFVCVGTPSAPNGSQDLTAIDRLCEQMGEALKHKTTFHTIVIRSTVEPGTVLERIQPTLEKYSGKISGKDFGLGFQPEFLREGSSIKDYDNPPFTIIGANSEVSINALREVFGHLPGEFVSTDIGTAECLKYACNAFHALKVTFANEIGRFAQSVNVDSHKVMDLVCRDSSLNISRAYLRPGFAFGGSCLPKDLRAMLHIARGKDVSLPTLQALLESNIKHIEHARDFVLAQNTREVGFIGLSFKSGTDDLRESPLVALAEAFIGKGLNLKIYDPEVNVARLVGANKRHITESIPHISSLMVDSVDEVIGYAKVLVVGLSDKDLVARVIEQCRPDQVVLDLIGIPGSDAIRAQYRGICW